MRRRAVLGVLAALAVLGPLVWFRQASLLPDAYRVTEMGATARHGDHRAGPGPVIGERNVDELVDTTPGPAAVELTLTARQDGDRFTLNGSTPGPEIRVEQGQLVAVRLENESVAEGVTLHWHGVDVPNAMDGVAGITQDAVPVGGSFTYRFTARQAGTYWYHSHQLSHRQVRGGLLGALIVTPPGGPREVRDVTALAHLHDGQRTVNGRPGEDNVAALPGDRVRVRVINTDPGPMPVWVSGAEYRLVAIDGTDVHEPGRIRAATVLVTAGGRADLELVVPPGGTRVELGGSAALVLGSPAPPPTPRPGTMLDPLHYGTPASPGFDPDAANRRYDYVIGRAPGFLDGVPGLWWTINGQMYPNVPMFDVAEGDIVAMRIENSLGDVHPMHLHGHHILVLARDGVAATGSPWWVDSLDVGPGATYDVAFVADNPGIWADHCHNLQHAAEGMVAHLMYAGVNTQYQIGGPADNAPE